MGQNSGSSSYAAVNPFKIRHLIRHHYISNTLSWQGQGLTPGVAYQSILIVFWNIWHRNTAINQLTIWLIRNNKYRVTIFLFLLVENLSQLLYGIRVNEKASLVLINESAKSFNELAAARNHIINTVFEKFGFRLAQEPVELA